VGSETHQVGSVTQRPIRVLHVLGTLDPGGVETWLLNVWRNIDRERFQFDFCTFGDHAGLYAPEMEKLGARVIPCPKGRNVFSLGRRFRKILREGHYDVVHSHVLYFSGAVLRWAKQEKIPARIAHAHSTSDGKQTSAMRRIYRRRMRAWIQKNSTKGLAASTHAAATVFGAGWAQDPRFRVLYYGIELQAFEGELNRAELRGELAIPEHSPVVGHVGRFVEAKNHRFLLRVARELLTKRPEAHFLLIGDGPLREGVEAEARAIAPGNQIHFLGVRKDVPQLLRGAMDIFLFPSLWEGLGLALVEAQAAGLPCLASDAVPRDAIVVPELVHSSPLADGAEEWAAKLLTLLRQAPRDRNGHLGAFRRSHFSIDRSVQSLSELYVQSIARNGSGG
jgi:glycosyltransferase involved in cell wall biosynthesis